MWSPPLDADGGAVAASTACDTLAFRDVERREWRATMAVVEVWAGHRMVRVVTLVDSSYTIGSDDESVAIALDDPTASGVHALLERVASTWLFAMWAPATAHA